MGEGERETEKERNRDREREQERVRKKSQKLLRIDKTISLSLTPNTIYTLYMLCVGLFYHSDH